MLLATVAVIGLTAIAAAGIVSHRDGVIAGARPTRVHAASPIDEAERILSERYARGEIMADEYDRMLVILRR